MNFDLTGASFADAPRPEGPASGAPTSPPDPDRSVRPALVDDAPAIARIQAAAFSRLAPAGEFIDEAGLERAWTETLHAPPPPGFFTLVALHGLGVAGFALVVPAQALELEGARIDAGSEIAELHVDPRFARSGHGSRLLQAIADLVRTPTLRTWAFADDEARTRFLTSAGFAPAGLRRTLDGGGGALVQHLWWASLDS